MDVGYSVEVLGTLLTLSERGEASWLPWVGEAPLLGGRETSTGRLRPNPMPLDWVNQKEDRQAQESRSFGLQVTSLSHTHIHAIW